MASVVLQHLTKTYADATGGGVDAVKGVSLTIASGEFMVLVGPSGCGKSTTLRMIAGLEEISDGTVAIDNRVVNDVPPKDRDIAMVFQNYALYPHMTVFENMAFGLTLRKHPRAEIETRVREAAAMLGIEDLLGRKPKTLSGGQRQRVAVGRAVVRQPKVFLFDEPLSNLDAKLRGTTRAEISRLHARLGATMIYVTHDQAEAMTMGDRICVMKDGRVMQVADPLTLYHRPRNMFVAGFIGAPPMNFFRGKLRSAGDSIEFVEHNAPGKQWVLQLGESQARRAKAKIGMEVVLGIRPEDIMLRPGGAAGASVGGGMMRIELVEPLGAETHLHLSTGSTSCVARVKQTERFEIGQTIAVQADPRAVHLFDPTSDEPLDGNVGS